ncbi:MAG: hypothetical protein ACRD1T_04030 [Acidimicrobiia bacterium]
MTHNSGGEVLDLAKNAFATRHLTSRPLFAVNPLAPAHMAFDDLQGHSFDVAPVDDGGSFYRYVERDWLASSGVVEDFAKPIQAPLMIPDSAPLHECLDKLTSRPWLFVLEKEEVSGIVALADLQAPSVSVFVFANILSIEANLKSRIAAIDGWVSQLNPERTDKLEQVHQMRRKYNVDTDLIDALMLDDQARLIAKLKIFKQIGFDSRNKFEGWAEDTKRLRDMLAHGGNVLDQNPDPKLALEQVLGLYDLATAISSDSL